MKQTVSSYDFERAFLDMDRQDQFSYDGLNALYDYLTECEELTGEELELDVIGICCDFVEYENIEAYNEDYEPVDTIQEIEDYTTVIMIDDESFIILVY